MTSGRRFADSTPNRHVGTRTARTSQQDQPGYCELLYVLQRDAGMCNMAFCDGSVHQISYGIAATIFSELGNRADGQAIDASMYETKVSQDVAVQAPACIFPRS